MFGTLEDEQRTRLVSTLVSKIQERGQPSKKEWWEKYLKHVIPFYGVPMAGIRSTILEWKQGEEPPEDNLFEVAMDLMRQQVAEAKIAGILILQEHIFDHLDSEAHLPRIGRLFEDQHIYDWNTTDWLCIRVLGQLIERDGNKAIAILREWVHSEHLWQRRASLVSFVPVVHDYQDTALELAAILANDSERFAQTAIGWTLRDLAISDPDALLGFIQQHQATMSREAIRMASAKLSDEQRAKLGMTEKRRRR